MSFFPACLHPQSRYTHIQSAEGAKRMLKTRGRKPTTVTTSAAVTSPTRLERANNIDPVYSEDDAACTPTKKAATKKVKRSAASLEEITSKTPSAQKGKGFSNLKQTVPREEHNSKKDASSTCKEKKRGSVFIAQDSNSQPRRKRIKSGTTETDIDPFLHKNSDLSDKAPLITSKKRRRNLEDAEREVEDGAGKSTKRKKHSTPSESRQAPEIIVEEDSMKPVMKTSTKTKVTKSTRKGKKQSSNNGTTASYVNHPRHYIRTLNSCFLGNGRRTPVCLNPPRWANRLQHFPALYFDLFIRPRLHLRVARQKASYRE